MKVVSVVLTILGLSLATWYFFYVQGLPLTPPETSVVTGLWLVVVLFVRWIWRRKRKAKAQK
jgi:hypothetical protein